MSKKNKTSKKRTKPCDVSTDVYFSRLAYEFNKIHQYVDVDKIFSRIRKEYVSVRKFISARPLFVFSEDDVKNLVFERLEKYFRKEILYEVGVQIAYEEVFAFANKHINIDKRDLTQTAIEAMLRANINVSYDNNRIYKYLHTRLKGALLDDYRRDKGSRCKVPKPLTIPFSAITEAAERGTESTVVRSIDLFEDNSEYSYDRTKESIEIRDSYEKALEYYEGKEFSFLQEYFDSILNGNADGNFRNRQKLARKHGLTELESDKLLKDFQEVFQDIHC